MDFLRRHGFFMLCGVAAVGGVVLGVTGLQRMPRVLDEMKQVEALHRDLAGLESQPVTRRRIEQEEARIERVLADRRQILDKARELYGYEPLIPNVCNGGPNDGQRCDVTAEDPCPGGGQCEGVFPDGPSLKRLDFRREYKRAMEELLASLNWGRPASKPDEDLMKKKIADEQAALRDFEMGRLSIPPNIPTGPPETEAGVLTPAGVRVNERARASIFAAQRIFCYATDFHEEKPPSSISSLHFHPAMVEIGVMDPPDPFDAWHAQLNYWIQKDVVAAINAVNESAADQLRARGVHPWVGNLPIKDVVSVRVGGEYVRQEAGVFGGSRPGGYDAAIPPISPHLVFTRSANTDWYEVVQTAIKLVMDQRYIGPLIQQLSADRFHTVLNVSYESVPFNRRMVGKIYGSDPVVNVVLDVETIMLGDLFRPWMPQSVCDAYLINCPPRPQAGG